jgi:hypothetical protein
MENPKRARSWKRRLRPRVNLKNDVPVLYSTRCCPLEEILDRKLARKLDDTGFIDRPKTHAEEPFRKIVVIVMSDPVDDC